MKGIPVWNCNAKLQKECTMLVVSVSEIHTSSHSHNFPICFPPFLHLVSTSRQSRRKHRSSFSHKIWSIVTLLQKYYSASKHIAHSAVLFQKARHNETHSSPTLHYIGGAENDIRFPEKHELKCGNMDRCLPG